MADIIARIKAEDKAAEAERLDALDEEAREKANARKRNWKAVAKAASGKDRSLSVAAKRGTVSLRGIVMSASHGRNSSSSDIFLNVLVTDPRMLIDDAAPVLHTTPPGAIKHADGSLSVRVHSSGDFDERCAKWGLVDTTDEYMTVAQGSVINVKVGSKSPSGLTLSEIEPAMPITVEGFQFAKWLPDPKNAATVKAAGTAPSGFSVPDKVSVFTNADAVHRVASTSPADLMRLLLENNAHAKNIPPLEKLLETDKLMGGGKCGSTPMTLRVLNAELASDLRRPTNAVARLIVENDPTSSFSPWVSEPLGAAKKRRAQLFFSVLQWRNLPDGWDADQPAERVMLKTTLWEDRLTPFGITDVKAWSALAPSIFAQMPFFLIACVDHNGSKEMRINGGAKEDYAPDDEAEATPGMPTTYSHGFMLHTWVIVADVAGFYKDTLGVPLSRRFVEQYVQSGALQRVDKIGEAHAANQHRKAGAPFVTLNEWNAPTTHFFDADSKCVQDDKTPRWVFRALVPGAKFGAEERAIFADMAEQESAGFDGPLAEALLDPDWAPKDAESHAELDAEHVLRTERVRPLVSTSAEAEGVVIVAIDMQQYAYSKTRYEQPKVRLAYMPERMWESAGHTDAPLCIEAPEEDKAASVPEAAEAAEAAEAEEPPEKRVKTEESAAE